MERAADICDKGLIPKEAIKKLKYNYQGPQADFDKRLVNTTDAYNTYKTTRPPRYAEKQRRKSTTVASWPPGRRVARNSVTVTLAHIPLSDILQISLYTLEQTGIHKHLRINLCLQVPHSNLYPLRAICSTDANTPT
ncbi:hypothetical protein PROFUN_09782 [Planoprotostelium fungivorum]|uniref:Uncharacterized protein n=1 Tax=Planoprotostelium fungivorum TaxID=1890364 RepID=A0A2P6NGM5_9EUKA|nr:hypothetical protein PROFUN_09782 [Planoprotostelium fungivorum]